MPSPELRCLECDRQFADLTADQEVERCANCGKFVVATAKKADDVPNAEVVAEVAIPTVGQPKSSPLDDLPVAKPVAKAVAPKVTLPAWARREDEPAAPTPAKPTDSLRPTLPPRPATWPRSETMSNTELPNQIEVKKPKIGLALLVAFLFFLAMLIAIAVLGYTIFRGLQMKKVITEQSRTQVALFSRTSES